MHFGATGVTATGVTPSTATYWSCACFTGGAYARRQAIVEDTDGDGVVLWAFDGSRMAGLFTMIDGGSGEIVTGLTPDATPQDAVPFPPKAFLRDENGHYARFVMTSFTGFPNPDWFYLLWARPGVGAWSSTFILGGSLDDLPAHPAGMYDLRRMQPVDGSPATPSGLLPDDFFIVQDYRMRAWTGARVGPRLGEASGGGVVVYATTAGGEDEGKMTVTLARIDGTDGAASVHYETSDDTAHSGVHYQATSGTLAFRDGQIFASFDVPVIDDAIVSTGAAFKVTLSAPSGATLGIATLLVAIVENDTTPVATLENVSAAEGDGEPIEVAMKVTLDHSAPAPVTLEWNAALYYDASQVLDHGVLEFAVGEKQKSLIIHYTGDDVWDPLHRYTVSVTKAVNAAVYRTATVNFIEDDPRPTTTTSNITVSEADGIARIAVTLSEALTFDYSLLYLTTDGTAKSPADYAGTNQMQAYLDAGASVVTIDIPIRNDSVAESTESFQVKVYPVGGGDPIVATVTILDDDGVAPPQATIEHATMPEGDGGAREVPIKVTLSAAAAKPVTLNWKAYDLAGGATLDTGVLSFSTGEKEKSLPLRYVADDLWGANRELGIAITSAQNATAVGEGRITIIEDESVPVLTVNDVVVRESDGVAVVRGGLSGAMRGPLNGTYATTAGIAAAFADYIPRSGNFHIDSGETDFAIEVPISNDALAEATETFVVSLGTKIATPVSLTTTVTILDDDAEGRRRSMRH